MLNQTILLRIIQQCLPVLNKQQSIVDIALSLYWQFPFISVRIILKVFEIILNLQFWNYIITPRMHQLVSGIFQLDTLINLTTSSHSQHWRISVVMKWSKVKPEILVPSYFTGFNLFGFITLRYLSLEIKWNHNSSLTLQIRLEMDSPMRFSQQQIIPIFPRSATLLPWYVVW